MDDLVRQLRDLGEGAQRDLDGERLVPRPDVPRRARHRRAGWVLGSTLVSVALLAGGAVGVRSIGGSGTPVGDNVLASAAQATREQGTALMDFEMRWRSSLGGPESELTATGEGEIDFLNQRSRLVVEADASFGSQSIDLIQAGTATYTKTVEQELWVRTEVPGAMGFAGQEFRLDDYLGYLSDMSHSVEELGQEEIDGVSVTKYRAHLDWERTEAEIPEEAAEILEGNKFDYQPAEVWVDEEGLVRRMTFGFVAYRVTDGQESLDMLITMSFHDFGAPVDIEIPDESEVTEMEASEDFGGSGSASASESVELNEGEPADPEGHILLMTSNDLEGLTGEVFGSNLCVFRAPEWATRVDLMVDGRPVASFGEKELEEPDDGTPRKCQLVADIEDEIREGDLLTFRVMGASRTKDFRIVEIRQL